MTGPDVTGGDLWLEGAEEDAIPPRLRITPGLG